MKKRLLKYLSLSSMLFLVLAYFKHYIGKGITKMVSMKSIKW